MALARSSTLSFEVAIFALLLAFAFGYNSAVAVAAAETEKRRHQVEFIVKERARIKAVAGRASSVGRGSTGKRKARGTEVVRKGTCESDHDCSLLGHCVETSCRCKPGWTGDSCARANLLPLDVTHGYHNATAASWGGLPFKDARGDWQLIATEIAWRCPLILFEHNSQVIRATSTTKSPEGPYEYSELVLPPFHHNPTVVGPTPDGTFLMFFIGTNDDSQLLNCTEGIPPGAHKIQVESNKYITMAWTKDPVHGPWQQRVVLDDHKGNQSSWHCTSNNPSAQILSNGTIVVVYRADNCNKARKTSGEFLGVAVADNYTAAFVRDTDPIVSPHTDLAHGSENEDPFVWVEADGSWHIVNHQQNNGNVCHNTGSACAAHFFATNPHGPWSLSPEPVYAEFVTLTNGTEATFQTRQRPQLLFDPETGNPTHLITGGSFFGTNPDMHILTHTFIQAFNTTRV